MAFKHLMGYSGRERELMHHVHKCKVCRASTFVSVPVHSNQLKNRIADLPVQFNFDDNLDNLGNKDMKLFPILINKFFSAETNVNEKKQMLKEFESEMGFKLEDLMTEWNDADADDEDPDCCTVS